MLDPADRLAARLARDGDPEDLYFEQTETRFAIGWKGNYRIDGAAFIYTERDTGRVLTILGYPTEPLAQLGLENFKYVWLVLKRWRNQERLWGCPLT